MSLTIQKTYTTSKDMLGVHRITCSKDILNVHRSIKELDILRRGDRPKRDLPSKECIHCLEEAHRSKDIIRFVITGKITRVVIFGKLLNTIFNIKDLGELKYFIGFKIRKYAFELLQDMRLLVKPCSTPIDCKTKFSSAFGELLFGPNTSCLLIRQLLYLKHT
ncbi:hypothetical protein CR513_08355, partial [Mucuna pruriens]